MNDTSSVSLKGHVPIIPQNIIYAATTILAKPITINSVEDAEEISDQYPKAVDFARSLFLKHPNARIIVASPDVCLEKAQMAKSGSIKTYIALSEEEAYSLSKGNHCFDVITFKGGDLPWPFQ